MKLDRDRLIRAREVLGYGLEKTAEEAGISKNSVLRAEHEEDIRPSTARKIATALGVDVAALYGEEMPSPKAPEPFSLEWARTARDAEFYRLIMMAPEEDTGRLDKLSGELYRFISRPVKRILTERNNKTFKDAGPEPKREEEERLRERFDALYAEVNRRRPPFARLWMSHDGNECRWLIPPDQWEEHRESVDRFFDGEPYVDVDAREEVLVYEEEIALSA